MPEWELAVRRQLAGLNLAPVREAEIAEELAQHAEDRYRELLGAGAAEAEARRAALEEVCEQAALAAGLRAVEQTDALEPAVLGAESSAGSMRWLCDLGPDLRYGLRSLRKNPGFTAIAVFALALGIGANTAIFSVVNGVLLRPLAYPEPDRLAFLYETTKEFEQASVSYPDYQDWRRDNRSFTDLGAARSDDFVVTGVGEPEQVSGAYVTASLLPLLGVSPAVGRVFLPQEDRHGAGCTAVLSYEYWQERFGGDRGILARPLAINTSRCSVIGILPPGLNFRGNAKVLLPIELWNSVELRVREVHPGIQVTGRLKPGVSLGAAQSEMAALCAGLARQYPASNAGRGVAVVRMKDDMVGYVRSMLLMLVGAVAFVLLIACANVANLLLARATARKREFAIRAALGAQRARVVRQLLTESVLLALGGAALGIPLAQWGTRMLLATTPSSLPRSGEIDIDLQVLLFTILVSILTGILFGLAPALHSAKADPQESLKEGARGAGGGRHRAESVFVAVQVGLAVILLSGAGLMVQSIWRLMQVHPGFNTSQVLTAKVALGPSAQASPHAIRLAYQQMLERVGATPGVESVALATQVPLATEHDSEIPYWPSTGPQPPQDQLSVAMFFLTTQDYLKVMRVPLLKGRFLNDRDTTASSTVIVIDDVMASRIFPGQDPVGKRISLMVVGTAEIVGVVGHVKFWGLDADDTFKIRDQIYFPFMQVPDKFLSEGVAGVSLMMRTRPEPLSLVSAVRSQVAGPTRDQPIYDVRTMQQVASTSLSQRRFTMLVLIVFAGTALLLAAVGIYGVMSYAVTRRTHELGLRTALGATRGDVVGLVVRQGMTLAAIGMAAGLAAALALTRFLADMLYGVRPSDPATLAAVLVLLAAIALAACYIPARRATAVDPVAALRCE